MIKLAGTIFKAMNIFVVLLYLAACLIPLLPAGKFWMISVLGLIFPLLFCIVAVFLVGWLIARSRWCWLSMVALLLSWQQVLAMAGFNGKKEFSISKPNETLRVLTWNVSCWGVTSKSFTKKIDYLPLMIDLVKNQQADVLCFQEYWDQARSRKNYSNTALFRQMGYPYSYYVKTFEDEYRMGVIILSKYPITDTVEYSYGERDFAEHLISADIQFRNQKIRLFTTHLQSVRFEQDEYNAISKIKHTDETGLKDSKTIVRKLRHAYQFREEEADLVKEKIKESPYPVIICGDFNDVPNSYTYFTIRGNLQDAFLEKGRGFGRTFQYLFPTLRIDYILADKSLTVEQFKRVKVPYSDHYPVVADFTLSSAPAEKK